MADVSSPPASKPGLHSYNLNRRMNPEPPKYAFVRHIRTILLLSGLLLSGYYGYTLADQYIYQAYQNWSFDQHIGGRAATFSDWLRARTPISAFMSRAKPEVQTSAPQPIPAGPETQKVMEGSLLGRVEIGRLGLSAIVREGVDDKTLARAVGHIPSTAMPGSAGNFAIAAHRDTLFRGLKDIKGDDLVTFQSERGTYTYKVISTRIVLPSNVGVLEPPDTGKWLTMITCYPFYYVGSAPKRFIVQAKLVSSDIGIPVAQGTAATSAPSPPSVAPPVAREPESRKSIRPREPRHHRGSSLYTSASSHRSANYHVITGTKPKKKGIWHRIFRNKSE